MAFVLRALAARTKDAASVARLGVSRACFCETERCLSSVAFGRWAKQVTGFVDQALAGPGSLANAEEVVFDFGREDGRDLRGWRVATDGGIGE